MYQRNYKGFTLVEMLIVMGILAILMAIGVAVARFAIQRANNIQHQSAADQMFQAFQSYYTDKRKYPPRTGTGAFGGFGTALASGGVLDPYVDANYDGGSPATYYYFVSTDQQSFLVCVSFGGIDDSSNLGGYCNGNGFGSLPSTGANAVTNKIMDGPTFTTLVRNQATSLGDRSNWDAAASSQWTEF